MRIERKKDGTISIKTNNGRVVIGTIGASGVSVNRDEEKYRQWIEECAKTVTPCAHTFKEMEQYFLEHCYALPIDPNDRRMKSFQLNVIMNHFKDKLQHQAVRFSPNMTDEEIKKWYEEDRAVHEEAMNSSAERFGLKMRGYYLPQTVRNKLIYEHAYDYDKIQKLRKPTRPEIKDIKIQDICFYFEETTEHCYADGGGSDLMDSMIVFRGVNQDDIEKRNSRFLSYISTLRDMGKLPDFR